MFTPVLPAGRRRLALTALVVAVTLGPAAVALADPSCARSGAFTTCSDGTTYFTTGNQTQDSNGRVWTHHGDVSISNDGQVIRRLPGQSYNPEPLAWPPFGQGPLPTVGQKERRW